MVNGRPSLTLGDNQALTSPQLRRQVSKTAVNGQESGSFASFLNKVERAVRPKELQPTNPENSTASRALAAKRQSGSEAAARQDVILARQAEAQAAGAAARAGNQPIASTNSITSQLNRAQYIPSNGVKRSSSGAGTSKAAAQGNAQSEMASFRGNRSTLEYAQSLSNKNSPVMSGVPITGRGNLGQLSGMQKKPIGRSTLVGKGDLSYSSTANNAKQALLMNMDSGKSVPQAKVSRGGGFGNYGMGSAPAGQNFATHGFGAHHAKTAMNNLGYDLNNFAPRNSANKAMEKTSPPLRTLQQGPAYANLSTRSSKTAPAALQASLKNQGSDQNFYPGRAFTQTAYRLANNELGTLAAKFESGSEGIAAIGYDGKGGTSYGKYQISSRAGTMRNFLSYLDEKAPDISKRLQAAGPANTGGRSGKMPNAWRQIASEDPVRFEALQSDFIRTSHFEPALQSIASSTGVGFETMPVALQEVVFSTAVQHGPSGAARIISQALNTVGAGRLQYSGNTITESFKSASRQLIEKIYALRAGQFGSSTSRIQASVKSRLSQEMREALQML